MPDLSIQKQAQRMRIYIGESDRWQGKPLYAALLETLKTMGIAGATVVRGVAGFGARSRIHTAAILRLSEDLPLVIDVVDSPAQIEKALEAVYPMVNEGLITVEEVRVAQYTHRYLHPLPADKATAEAMTRDVLALAPDLAVQAAWKRMLESGIKVFPVVDGQRQVMGILTDEDLLERAGVQQRLAVAARLDTTIVKEELERLEVSPLKVADVMSRPVVTARDDEPLGVVSARMVKAGLKRLPVVDSRGRLVGMLSRLDILHQVATAAPSAAHEAAPGGSAATVRDVMNPDVPTVALADGLGVLVEKFLQSGTHRLIVVDGAGKAVGLISDSDVVARVQPAHQRGLLDAFRRRGAPPAAEASAQELMSPEPLTTPPERTLVAAVQVMMAAGRKWLVVVDEAGKPLGLVDRGILLKAITSRYEG